MKTLFSVLIVLVPSLAAAMPVKVTMLKPRAYFQEAENNLLEPLDLKSKTLYFTKKEFDHCGANLVRRAQTLTYSCSFEIPSKSKVTRLQNLVSAKALEVVFGGTKREVSVHVSEDARTVTFTTAFDHTGVDFEVLKFNDDFFGVYNKVAQLIISDAIKANPVIIELLESRNDPVIRPTIAKKVRHAKS